jgi:hypothetical protein
MFLIFLLRVLIFLSRLSSVFSSAIHPGNYELILEATKVNATYSKNLNRIYIRMQITGNWRNMNYPKGKVWSATKNVDYHIQVISIILYLYTMVFLHFSYFCYSEQQLVYLKCTFDKIHQVFPN